MSDQIKKAADQMRKEVLHGHTCVIKRTGKRATGKIVTLPSGRRIKLQATGSHVANLTDEEIAVMRRIPDTRVTVQVSRQADAPQRVEMTRTAPKPMKKAPKKGKK